MRPLSAREAKLVAVGLLILLVALVWVAVIAPISAGFAARSEQRALLEATYARNSRLINAIPAVRRRAEQLRPLARTFALPATDLNRAQDVLRERLRADFAASGGEVRALQSVASTGGEARIWIEGRLTLADLEKLLVRINDTPPYLIVESLRLSADAALETGRLDKLDVRLEASIPYLPAAS